MRSPHPAPSLLSVATLATLALCVSLGSSACSSDGPRKPTAEERAKLLEIHIESAQQYLAMGELDRAEGQVEKGLEIDPKNQKLEMILGNTLIKRGKTNDFQRAEVIFRLLQSTDDFRATIGLALSLERLGVANDEAAADIRTGRQVTEAPDPVKRGDELARTAITCWKEARTAYERSLAQKPDNTDAFNGLARVCSLLHDEVASLGWSDKLIASLRADREFWEARLTRPELSADEEHRFRKLVHAQAEIEIDAHIESAVLLHSLHREKEAVAHLSAAAELSPDKAEIYSRRAESHMGLGQFGDALADLDTYLRLSPDKKFDHPDIKRAYRLQSECQEKLRVAKIGG